MMLLFTILLFSFSFNQSYWYNHAELDWETMETEHFIICFHQGTERSASEVANIAEIIYDKVTGLYEYEPWNKTRIIVEDVDDYSNGGAYFFDNKIFISGKPMDYDLRGAHRWLQDVITHEFTHIVQLGASMKHSRHVPGTYLQVVDYEEEKSENVFVGYPNKIISYPIPNTTVPPWFAEGVAQYMFEGANYDYWDSIRDMILRDRVINNNLLSYNEMNIFGKKGIGNESTYNQGFSLVKYIVKKYGEDSIRKITKGLSDPFTYSIDKAMIKVLGVPGNMIYEEWKKELEIIYSNQISKKTDQNNFTILEGKGTTNMHPVWSPNGKRFSYLSNKKNDYFGQTDLYIYDFEDSTKKKIKSGIKSAPTWINDSLMVYSKKSKPNEFGSKYFDLYQYDLNEEKEERLTKGLRLFSPYYDRNTQKIYAINTFDGTCNLFEGNSDFSEYEQITHHEDGTQIFSISIMDSILLYDAVENHERNIYKLNLNTYKISPFVKNKWDDRDPVYNNYIVTANDRFGIFNIYVENNTEEGYVTNVAGGAFMPDVSIDGKVLFSIYEDGVYKEAILNDNSILDSNNIGISNHVINRSDFSNLDNTISMQNNYYYRPTSNLINEGLDIKSSKYEINMSGPFIMPRLMFDKGKIKPGLYLFDNDYLNKLSVLAGVGVNEDRDVDVFMLFDHNKFKFSYYFNFYFITRNFSRVYPDISTENIEYPSTKHYLDFTYHLFAADIGTRYNIKGHKLWLTYSFAKYRQFYNFKLVQAGPETISTVGDGAYNYFSGHFLTLEYQYSGREKHYLYYMMPRSGFDIWTYISYEKNNIFEEFRANELVGFKEYLAPHNTIRYKLDFSKHWTVKEIKNNNNHRYITVSNNFKYMDLSKRTVDDFLYFHGGGLPGLKGYTFYEPTLQGPNFMLLTNKITYPFFTEKAYKAGFFHFNSFSVSLAHQIGKAKSGQIKTYSGHHNIPDEYNDMFTEIDENGYSLKNYIEGIGREEVNPICYGALDAMDVNNCIPDILEPYIYPNLYSLLSVIGWDNSELTNGKHMNMKDLKERYKAFKQSIGIEFKLYGFSFYSYPTALSYEFYAPISDSWNSEGRHYLKILFEFY